MKAIEVKYKGPTEHKGSRLIATDGDHSRLVVSTNDPELTKHPFDRQAAIVARRFADKMKWPGKLVQGSTKRGYVFVFVDDSFGIGV